MKRKYYIHTFGCQQNVADSERVATYCETAGMVKAKSLEEANYVIITTCMIRESAENRVYGMVHNLIPLKEKKWKNNEEFYKGIVEKVMNFCKKNNIKYHIKSGTPLSKYNTKYIFSKKKEK